MANAVVKGSNLRLKSPAQIEAEKKRVEEKKRKAGIMVFQNIVQRKPLADCWFEVYPDSKASRTQAKRMAGRHIRWFRLNFPIAIRQLLFLKGYDDDKVVDLIGEQLRATTPLKKGTRKFTTTTDDGETVFHEEIEYIQVREWKTFDEGVRNLITLGGHHARRGLVPDEREQEANRNPRNVTEPDTVVIRTREKLPDSEWQKKYQATLAESKESGRAERMIEEIERRVAEAEEAAGHVTHRPANSTLAPRLEHPQ